MLWRRSLVAKYPWFFGLVVVNVTRDVVLFCGSNLQSSRYTRFWLLTLPFVIFFQATSVSEAYQKFTGTYSGLQRFSSYLLRGSVGLLVGLSCISAALSFRPFTES